MNNEDVKLLMPYNINLAVYTVYTGELCSYEDRIIMITIMFMIMIMMTMSGGGTTVMEQEQSVNRNQSCRETYT